MDYRRLLLFAGIFILIGTFLHGEVQTFYQRRGRGKLNMKREFHPVGKSQQRGGNRQVWSESTSKFLVLNKLKNEQYIVSSCK